MRVWIDNVMSGELHGFRDLQEHLHRMRNQVGDRRLSTNSEACAVQAKINEHRRRNALALIRDLSHFDGKELGCGAQDGSDVFVEGKDSVKSFALFAGNPQSCHD